MSFKCHSTTIIFSPNFIHHIKNTTGHSCPTEPTELHWLHHVNIIIHHWSLDWYHLISCYAGLLVLIIRGTTDHKGNSRVLNGDEQVCMIWPVHSLILTRNFFFCQLYIDHHSKYLETQSSHRVSCWLNQTNLHHFIVTRRCLPEWWWCLHSCWPYILPRKFES